MPDIQMTEEQMRQVAEAQKRFAEFKATQPRLQQAGLDLLFHEARSHNGWQDKPVSDETLREVYDLTRMGATSLNSCPARIVFVRTAEGKQKIKPTLIPTNIDKAMSAPVVAILGYDVQFFSKMGQLFPHKDVAPMFAGNAVLAETTAFRNGTLQGAYLMFAAFRNGTLQGAYLMFAARALGLDCGPMSGFDNNAIDEAFFSGTTIKSNFLCCLGHGNPEKIFQRLPRLAFEEACELA